MKKLRLITAMLTFMAIGVLVTSCGNNPQAPAAYNNQLMKLMNGNQQDMEAMNKAMTLGNFDKAEDLRVNWEKELEGTIKKATSIDGFKGDDNLKNAVVKGLKTYKKMVSVDYKQLIEIRKKADTTLDTKENELLKNINEGFTKAGKTINQAATAFQQKYAK